MSIQKVRLVFVSMIFLACCQNAKKTTSVSAGAENLAQEKYGDGFACEMNSEKSRSLCTLQRKNDSGGYGVSFFVWDVNSEKVILEDAIDKGAVSWFSNDQLALLYTPGTMQQGQTNDDYTYILDVNTNERILKTKMNN